MSTLPISILHSIAEHYHCDGRDFCERFDLLWEAQLHKTGRIKSFVDLLLGCECALKCHIILGHRNEDPKTVYLGLREQGHNIGRLANCANYLDDRSQYEFLKDRLDPFSVFVRYSLDAYETFFPSAMERENALINYTRTIGSNPWVLEIRNCVESLLESTANEFAGFVTDDLAALIDHEQQMKEFADSCLRQRVKGRRSDRLKNC